MKVREHQREPLRRDLLLGIILLGLLMIAIGFRFIGLPLTVTMTVLSFIGLFIFIAPYVLSVNPALLKVVRLYLQEHGRAIWYLPTTLYLLSLFYLLLASLLTIKLFLMATAFCFVPLLLVLQARKKSSQFNRFDGLAILCLWLPIEFGLLSQASLPPRHGMMGVYQLVGLVLLIYFYVILRELPAAGFTYRLKFKEVQLSIQSCILFFIPALILGVPTEFIKLSHSVPGFAEMFGSFLAIGFFIALPEEILFRAVIQNALEQKWQNIANGQTRALLAASIIFGFAHSNNHNPPFINIDLGFLGVWHFPWVYVVLATLAGYAYGWTFMKTRKVTAAALVHLLVDWVWSIFFNG